MRILFVVPLYWPDTSGATKLLQGYAAHWATHHRVEVWTTVAANNGALFSPHGPCVQDGTSTHQGVRIRRFRLWHPPQKERVFQRAFRWPFSGSGYVFDVPHVASLGLQWRARTCRRRFDLVVGGYLPFTGFLYAAATVARRCRAPLVMVPLLHIGEPGDRTLLATFGRPLQRRMLHRADLLLVNSRVEASALVRWGINRGRIAIVGAGIDPVELSGGNAARFRARYGLQGPIVAQISTQTHDKGSHHLVEAMKQVWASGVDCHLVLMGQVLQDFEEYFWAQPREVFERTLVLGHVDEETKLDLLAATDVFAMISRAESFGIAFLEAWFKRKPVVGCYAGALPALISDGTDGLLVPFADVHMLAETIRILLTRPELRRRLGEAGYAKVRASFLWERRLRVLDSALQTVTRRP